MNRIFCLLSETYGFLRNMKLSDIFVCVILILSLELLEIMKHTDIL
jgi:hypothetical protein